MRRPGISAEGSARRIGQRPQPHCISPILLDATLAVREAVLHGAGLSVLPDCAIAQDLAAGRPIPVLPAGGIHAVFPSARFLPAKLRAFVEMLMERTAGQEVVRF
ncbi:hypothetical protein GCM10007242_05090 [Pigmentiphaga litoralis]|uniref:LysR substrate-binding domain-containing protein n=1 Tax=Pigmentiphaga litoralis TaxID=516702 RepID=UPI0019B17784|nr:hypothetical protein GCM10007242_05090 [Pigmentiphaga litoralis]